MTPSPLAVFPVHLLTPGFAVAGGILVSVPIIIHLLNRRRFKVVSWAAMDFLLKAMRQNRKRLKFEQWLLLATRCALLFLLALALARPLVGCAPNSLAGQIGGRSGLNVFVIDNAYSTAYEANHVGGGRTHLDQEKLIAKRLIDTLNAGGESVAVITAARPATAIIAKPGYDLNAARAAIDRIEPSYAAADLAGALHLARQLAEDDPRQPTKNLYLLTDGTRAAWGDRQGEAIAREGVELAKLYKVTHFNMTEGRQQWNQAAAGVKLGSNLVTTKFDIDLTADARGYGTNPDAALRWTLDGQPYGKTETVRLLPDAPPENARDEKDAQAAKLQLQILARDLKRGGPHLVTLTVGGDDPLKADNKRYRVLDVSNETRILIVEGKHGAKALEGSGTFLQIALAAPASNAAGPGGPKTNSYVAADLISDIDLSNKLLGDYKAVLLAGVGQVTEPQADALRDFVSAGGTLMLFMGEAVTKENYNATLLPRKLMPGPLIKVVDAAAGDPGFKFNFRPKSVPSPFLKAFANKENSGLDVVTVNTYWQADVPPNGGVDRVLDYLPPTDARGQPLAGATADPAITHHALGDGHVIFFSTSAGNAWTSFTAKIAYVELMHEMLAGGLRPSDAWMNLTVGQQVEIPSQIKLNGPPELLDEANVSILIDPVTERDANGQPKPTVYRSRPLTKPGVYTLNLGPAGGGSVPIAVNVPPDGADVRTIGNEAVRKALGDIDVSLQNDEIPAEASLSREGNDWAGSVLLIVLALLAVECFLAMSFGHYRRTLVAHA